MGVYTFAHLEKLLSRHELEVAEVGVFWREARLVRLPSDERALIGVPATLHLVGKLSAMVYAELPVATGSRVREGLPKTGVAWIGKKFRERRRARLLRFSLPDLGLFWRSEEDAEAVALARRFAQILLAEFPDPGAELMRQFHLDMTTLVAHLSTVPFLQAGTTQPGRGR